MAWRDGCDENEHRCEHWDKRTTIALTAALQTLRRLKAAQDGAREKLTV